MAGKREQAAWLAQLLSGQASTPVTVAWESDGVGRGFWWVRWIDGLATAGMREFAAGQAPFLRPLQVTALRWGRDYSPRAWANALVEVVTAQPQVTDWRELLGEAEMWLDDADHPELFPDAVHGAQAEWLLAHAGNREAMLAQATLSSRVAVPAVVTETGDVARCPQCGDALPAGSGAGRPARFCSPACRTRAWRQRTAASTGSVTKPGDEKRCGSCGEPIAGEGRRGRPARFCSPSCRMRAWRQADEKPAQPVT